MKIATVFLLPMASIFNTNAVPSNNNHLNIRAREERKMEVLTHYSLDVGHTAATANTNSHHQQQRQLMANWDINFLNFTATIDDFESNFEIGKDRIARQQLFAYDCVTPITNDAVYATSNEPLPEGTRTNKDDQHDILRLAYTIDKSKIVNSNIWDENASTIRVCQVLQLMYDPAEDGNDGMESLVINTDTRKFTIHVDMEVDISVYPIWLRDPDLSYLQTTIPATLQVENYDAPTTQEQFDVDKFVFATTIKEFATEGLTSSLQMVLSANVLDIGGDANTANVQYELTLQEPCQDADACEELKNTNTLYESVTSYILASIDNGSFTSRLQANAAKYALTRRELVFTQERLDIVGPTPSTNHEVLSSTSHHRRLSFSNTSVIGAQFDEPIFFVDAPAIPDIGYYNSTINIDDYIVACKCDSVNFECTDSPLVQNQQLSICTKSINTLEVELNILDSMFLNQGDTNFGIIEANEVQYQSFTSREYVSDMGENTGGVVVSTRVPSNFFEFGGGNFLTITGDVSMKFVGSTSRRSDRELQETKTLSTSDADSFNRNSSFRVKVHLESTLKAQHIKNSSGSLVASKDLTFIGSVVSILTLVIA